MILDVEKNALEEAWQAIIGGRPIKFKDRFSSLLSRKEFETLINLRPFTNMARFIPTFKVDEELEWQLPDWATSEDSLPAPIVKKLMNTGVCYLRDCSKANEKINGFCKMLESMSGLGVDAHVYFSKDPSLENHFGVHKDVNHNIIVQTDGLTSWQVGSKIYDESHPTTLEDGFYDDDETSIHTTLYPGDAIVVPAGIYHKPVNVTKRVSVSFSMVKCNVFEDRTWINWSTI